MRREQAHRFLHYSPELEQATARLYITGDEHHHLHRVLRTRSGDSAYVTNGRGLLVRATVESIDDAGATMGVEGVVEHRTVPERVTLALACLKKEAFEQAVKQCTELGITRCLPFIAARSHVREYSEVTFERLRRIALSAMKQSFRSILPSIESVVSFEGLLEEASGHSLVIAGEADAPPLAVEAPGGSLLLVVGPETGFTAGEVGRLEGRGCRFRSVSNHRLRSETAAAALVSALLSPSADRGGGAV
ncbi:MAG: RsmE family RNA methyltransferase [Candidatus Krumholzibacteriia bacterium]